MTRTIAGLSRLAGAALALTVSAQQALAQDSAGCERAARAVMAKSLPPAGSADWNNYFSLTNCGTRGATVIAGALQSSAVRTENDPARLDALTGLLDGWFAPSLVKAYEGVASSPTATPALRARAMWLLAGLVSPGVEVAGPLQGYVAATCSAYDRGTTLRDAPATLPQQAIDDARLTYARVASDTDSPEQLRSTARCWQDAVSGNVVVGTSQKSDKQSQQTSQQVAQQNDHQTQVVHDTQFVRNVVYQQTTHVTVVEPIEVEYECDGRFIVWNTGPSDLSVRYVVGGGPGGSLRLGGRGSHTFVATRFGPVSFYVGSRRMMYSNYSYRSCRDGYHHGYIYGGRYMISRPIYVPRAYYTPRREEPNRGAPRREEPRREEPRRAEPRREDPRREQPRQEQPRGNDGQRQGPDRSGGERSGGERPAGDRSRSQPAPTSEAPRSAPQAAPQAPQAPQASPRTSTPDKPAPSPRTAQRRIATSQPN